MYAVEINVNIFDICTHIDCKLNRRYHIKSSRNIEIKKKKIVHETH